MFDKDTTEEGIARANLHPVSAGADIFAAIRCVNAEIDRVLKHNVPQPPASLEFAAEASAALRSQAFVDAVKALDRLLDVAIAEMHTAKRDDVVKLLEDPLSSETRNTRRNLGVLTVLAVLVGVAGKAPDSMLGFGIGAFPRWAFPSVLGAVIIYEFVAFTLYLRSDLERRRIHSDAARHDRNLLLAVVAEFEDRERSLARFASGDVAAELLRGMAKVEEAANVAPKCSTLAAHWRQNVSAFDQEFGIQRRRRWWDEYMPFVLVVVANLALYSMIPSVRSWVWGLFHPAAGIVAKPPAPQSPRKSR